MERILEPEYMDTDAEASDYDAMDHSDSNRDALEQLVALGGGRGRVIDLGTGPGDIPILIAQACPQAHIVGVDAAATMLTIARAKIASANLTDRIEFELSPLRLESADLRASQSLLGFASPSPGKQNILSSC